MVGIPDVITYAHFGDDRLRGLGVAGGQSLPFSIDFDRRPYITLALPCECVMGTTLSLVSAHEAMSRPNKDPVNHVLSKCDNVGSCIHARQHATCATNMRNLNTCLKTVLSFSLKFILSLFTSLVTVVRLS